MKIHSGTFNVKVEREDIFKLTIKNASLHQDNKDTSFRIINFVTSTILFVRSTMFPHRNIHKYTWTSPDGKTHNQIDYTSIERRWHSSTLDVRSFRGADCDNDCYLVAAKDGQRLAVSKQAAQMFDGERLNLRKRLGKSIRLRLQTGLQLWRT
jgi:hypothetical protein